MTNSMLSALPGAATMAHPMMIRACRAGYAAATMLPVEDCGWIIRGIRRSWACASVQRVDEYLETLADLLADIEGAYDIRATVLAARTDLLSVGA